MEDLEVRFYPPELIFDRQSVGGNKIQPYLQSGGDIQYVGEFQNFNASDRPQCDAIWSDNPSQILESYASDCAVLAVTDQNRFGIVHFGWRELVKGDGIIDRFLDCFDRKRLLSVLGPCIHNFEIEKGSEADEVLSSIFDSKFFNRSQTDEYCFQFKDAVEWVLMTKSIFEDQITIDPRDTLTNYPALDSVKASVKHGKQKKGSNYLCIGSKSLYQDKDWETIPFPSNQNLGS